MGRPPDLISSLVFPVPLPSYNVDSFPGELLWVPKQLEKGADCPPEDCVPCLFLTCPSARFIVLLFHSNAEDLGRCHSFCCTFRTQFQVHVLAVEYPGYGICPGDCSEEGMEENAEAALSFITQVLGWTLDSIKIFGRSIGTGPAIALAAKYKVAGVILVTPFLSIRDVFKEKVGPLSHLVQERFPNEQRVPAIRSSTLFVHGLKDALIPVRHSERLFEICESRKLFISPSEMDHNTNLFCNTNVLVLPMLQFFSLPDFSFESFKVPEWAFYKGLSPSYQRPALQLQYNRPYSAVPGGGEEPDPEIPLGDVCGEPTTQEEETLNLSLSKPSYQGFIATPRGDAPPKDMELFAIDTQPTTRRQTTSEIGATKSRYDFIGMPRPILQSLRIHTPRASGYKTRSPSGNNLGNGSDTAFLEEKQLSQPVG